MMKNHTKLLLLIGAFALACDDAGPGETDSDTGTSPGAPRTVALAERNNYSYESALTIPSVETAVGADIEICWAGLTRDFQCHEMDPAADIDNATLVRIRNMTEAEAADALSKDGLQQSDIDGYLEFRTGGDKTCADLSAFSFRGSAVNIEEEYAVSDERKYLLVLTTGTVPGIGARMMTFLTPSEQSDNRTVTVDEDCDVLDFTAQLTDLTPLGVPDDVRTVLDWSNIAPPGVNKVMLGFYEGMTPRDLEERVLDLMLIADKKWELAVEGVTSVMLNDLEDENGNAFGGFEGDGAWVFALICETCQNPAPLLLTLLQPE
jgi:hypothetical protein